MLELLKSVQPGYLLGALIGVIVLVITFCKGDDE